jgi:hypothetical protein
MLSITYISPKKLKKNQWNTNKVSIENEEKLDKSLKEYGLFKPILCRTVNDELEIIGGEHRVESAIRNGISEIPIINLGNISDDKAKKMGLIDNGRYGSDDFVELQELINSLESPNELLEVLPYSLEDFEGIFKADEIDLDNIPSFEENSEIEDSDETENNFVQKLPETHAIVKFKIPLEFLQDLNNKIKNKEQELNTEYGDSLVNAGNALLALLFGDNYGK